MPLRSCSLLPLSDDNFSRDTTPSVAVDLVMDFTEPINRAYLSRHIAPLLSSTEREIRHDGDGSGPIVQTPSQVSIFYLIEQSEDHS